MIKQTDLLGLGFDRTSLLTADEAKFLASCGFKVAMRNCAGLTDDIFRQDVENCLAAGLAVGIYQGSYAGMWENLDTARQRAQAACHTAHAVNYPVQGTIWLNVENISGRYQTMKWIETWAAIVRSFGFGAGVYCGINTLSGQDFYDLAYVNHYWLNGSPAGRIEIPVRGFQIEQLAVDVLIAGIRLDIDFFHADRLGQAPGGMILC